jgi:hypothetical protein
LEAAAQAKAKRNIGRAEREKVWSCDLYCNYFILFCIAHCTGPPNPKWWKGRSLIVNQLHFSRAILFYTRGEDAALGVAAQASGSKFLFE